jgi:hypothetical protein
MGVDHRRRHIGMPQQFLHRADVVAGLQQMRRERVSDGRCRAGAPRFSTSPSRWSCRQGSGPDRRTATARRRPVVETANRHVALGPRPPAGTRRVPPPSLATATRDAAPSGTLQRGGHTKGAFAPDAESDGKRPAEVCLESSVLSLVFAETVIQITKRPLEKQKRDAESTH